MRPPFRACLRVLLMAILAVCAGAPARGQCEPRWLPGDGVPGVFGTVRAMTLWDPDGVGPAATKLVVAGEFLAAGDIEARNIAMRDPASGVWESMGAGLDGVVHAVAVLADGTLAVTGEFNNAGGGPARGVARWDGQAWSSIGGGLAYGPYEVRAYTCVVLSNGDLVVGGRFTTAGGVVVNNIARWNGAAWTGFSGGSYQDVRALAEMPNGDLIAGGDMTTIGGTNLNRIARWDGSSWSSLGTGLNGVGTVYSLTVTPGGDLIAAGRFDGIGGVPAPNIARWDGSTWSSLGAGIGTGAGNQGYVYAVSIHPVTGHITAGGQSFYHAGGQPANNIARWDGNAWYPLGDGIGRPPGYYSTVYAMCRLPQQDRLIVGGTMNLAGGVGVDGMASWDGAAWSPVVSGTNAAVLDLALLPDGGVVAGGHFAVIEGTPAMGIARWDGDSWSPLGTGVDGSVMCVAALPAGGVLAGGTFTTAGGVGANRIARWGGASWSGFGTGMNGDVYAVAVMPNGDVVAGGTFTTAGGAPASRIARWNGTAWSPLGSGVSAPVYSIVTTPGGEVFAGGIFSNAGVVLVNFVARWDGAAWSALAGGMNNSVFVLSRASNGDLLAGGAFSTAGGAPAARLARWNGGQWTALATSADGPVSAVIEAAPSRLWVGGRFTNLNGVSANRIALLEDGVVSPLGDGITGIFTNNVNAVVEVAGDILAGGEFLKAGPDLSSNIARWGIPPECRCDTIDFNNDSLFPDTGDISDFLEVFGGGACSTGLCNDIDFNNDGLFPDTIDITALLGVFSGGPCLR